MLTREFIVVVSPINTGSRGGGGGGGGGGVVHAPRILCHISILVTALEFCSTV